jgi:hypothetical protein
MTTLYRNTARTLISIFTLYQVTCMVAVPLSTNEISQRLSPWISPYAKTLGFVGNWGFFAPNPGPPPTYLEWETTDANGKTLSSGIYPETSSYFSAEGVVRREASVAFMLAENGRAGQMMTPYLCQGDPRTFAVRLTWVFHPIPSIQEAAAGKSIHDESLIERKPASYEFCGETL